LPNSLLHHREGRLAPLALTRPEDLRPGTYEVLVCSGPKNGEAIGYVVSGDITGYFDAKMQPTTAEKLLDAAGAA
jgi:hypothetical protein